MLDPGLLRLQAMKFASNEAVKVRASYWEDTSIITADAIPMHPCP